MFVLFVSVSVALSVCFCVCVCFCFVCVCVFVWFLVCVCVSEGEVWRVFMLCAPILGSWMAAIKSFAGRISSIVQG